MPISPNRFWKKLKVSYSQLRMRVLGVDPGTLVMGYGIIDEKDGNLHFVSGDDFKLLSKVPIEKRILTLYQKLSRIVDEFKPDVAAVEEPFLGENIQSALSIGRAQAAAMLAIAERNIEISRYTPTQVKQSVSGYGGGSKSQTKEMVKILLNIQESNLSEDTADALAVAICCIQEKRLNWIRTYPKGA